VATRKKARVAEELAQLETCPPAELCNAWEQQEGNAAPNIGPALLRRLLAYSLQERQFGGLPTVVARELDRAASAGSGNAIPAPRQELTPGSRLVREWNGRTISVTVTEDGFLWDGQTRRSLSEIAREVTGAHWSGPRFFGLIRRG
jgi:hypothetical protein